MSDKGIDLKDVENILSKLVFKFNVLEGTTATVCHAFYKDFNIGYGMSACVDPVNFSKELGEKYALKRAAVDAKNNIWRCEVYALAFHNYVKQVV